MGYHSHSVGRVGSLWDTAHIVWAGCEKSVGYCSHSVGKVRRNGEMVSGAMS